jgi:superoxide dismutase, Cu-Zn family
LRRRRVSRHRHLRPPEKDAAVDRAAAAQDGAHIHTVGRCDPPDFASAGGHFDPGPAGNTDPDMNHPYHSGDLLNIVANATGAVVTTSYTTRINLGGPLSPLDADGAAIIIHQNPDTNQTGTKGQGGGGGTAIACGVIVK